MRFYHQSTIFLIQAIYHPYIFQKIYYRFDRQDSFLHFHPCTALYVCDPCIQRWQTNHDAYNLCLRVCRCMRCDRSFGRIADSRCERQHKIPLSWRYFRNNQRCYLRQFSKMSGALVWQDSFIHNIVRHRIAHIAGIHAYYYFQYCSCDYGAPPSGVGWWGGT